MRKFYIYGGMFILTSILPVWFHTLLLPTLLILMIPFFLDSIPSARGYENLWAFTLLLVEAFPLNACIIEEILPELEIGNAVEEFLVFCLFIIVAYSIEEVIIGKITRRLYHKQVKVKFK